MKVKNFKDKLVFITGGSEGIGLALAKEFVRAQASVVIFARSLPKLKRARNILLKECSHVQQQIMTFPLDVTKAKDVKRVLGHVVKKIGVPDIFINNVGRALPNYFEKISFKQLAETMAINFYSVWHCLSFMLPLLKKKGGNIVNVSSMAGYLGVFGYSDYTASKFAIIGLTEVLAAEYKNYNIRFSVLCPPDTNTKGFVIENKHKPPETRAISQSAKCLDPQTVAKACLKGIKKGKFIINPGLEAKVAFFLKRLWPSFLTGMFDRIIKKTQQKLKKGSLT